ncbi:Enoyl-CoA hydratase [Candidatus Rhodobacter oscarellae]|uniref:Enoyl-CoA hydratase n=1 Tax=Candidatus Rhodobacter oscarellae TaxID=1675527 RepID=A0A0J9E8H5_9RHOB|nr:crotonase/enoyl-CoA hydratase family protein [Candidatus Rhodobacter lobularis]KMW58039.1 Enoyl-CoA hydratase [Candidatus Rhodobacter lobularis]
MAVRIEKEGPVWTVINDRFDAARNAVDPEHAELLHDAFLEFDATEAAQVAVFWGAGGAFCAGWDLKYAASLGDPARFTEEIAPLDFPEGDGAAPRGPMGPSRLQLSKPVIAAVEGPAVAGGMELALWADCRVMGESAFLGVYCRRWGIPLIDGGTFRLPRLVGEGRALEIAMTGRKVPAEECLAIGLCERVVPDGEARAAAEAMAHEIARFPSGAMLADRASIRGGHGLPPAQALRAEWARGLDAARHQGIAGAGRFAGGKGRGGDFGDI